MFAARSIEGRNKPSLDRIDAGHKYDRNRCGRLLCRLCTRGAERKNNSDATADEVGNQLWRLTELDFRIPIQDFDIASFDEALLGYSLAEWWSNYFTLSFGKAAEKTDHRRRPLLRPRNCWPRRRRCRAPR